MERIPSFVTAIKDAFCDVIFGNAPPTEFWHWVFAFAGAAVMIALLIVMFIFRKRSMGTVAFVAHGAAATLSMLLMGLPVHHANRFTECREKIGILTLNQRNFPATYSECRDRVALNAAWGKWQVSEITGVDTPSD